MPGRSGRSPAIPSRTAASGSRASRSPFSIPKAKTADVLEKANIPFAFMKNPDALEELNEGMLLIGEGTAWRDCRSLGESMVKAAARGLPVLCLAPGDGSLVLPGTAGAELPSPARLTLRRDDVIGELDKRLDAAAWPPKGLIDSAVWQSRATATKSLPKRARLQHAWSWLEMRYAVGKGRLLVCGFGIIRQWDATPTPRYLLPNCCCGFPREKPSSPSTRDERKN